MSKFEYSRIGSLIQGILDAMAKRIKTQKAIAELEAMSDHELKDIGINRGDIEWVVKGK